MSDILSVAEPGSLPMWGKDRGHLAIPLEIERSWTPDHEAMVAALRVVLGLTRQLRDPGQRGGR